MYKRRVAILLSAMGLVFLALLGRLFVLQIVHGQQSRDEYERSLTRQSFYTASRGAILDRNGRVLARDNLSYEFCMDYGLIAEDPAWIRNQQRALKRQLKGVDDVELAEMFQERLEHSLDWAVQACGGREQFEIARRQIVARVERIAEIINDRPAQTREFHVIAQLDDEAAYRYFKDHIEGLPGVAVRHGRKRDYPAGEFACHIIGHIRPVSREDLAAHNRTADEEPDAVRRALYNYRPTDIIGDSGVEKLCEAVLKPTRGYESTTAGKTVETIAPHDGRDVHLTIDMRLQHRLTEFFRKTYPNHNGCIVVMDVASGEVLAMVSIPTYNLQTHRRRVSEAEAALAAASPPRRNSREWIDRPYALLSKDDYDYPLLNRGVQVRRAPGSTLKPFTALAALTEGIIDDRTTVTCYGRMYADKPDRLRCMGHHDSISLANAMRTSCNVYFWWCGEWMYQRNPRLFPEWLARAGMLDMPGTGLPEEVRGVLNFSTEAGVRRGESRDLGIGQGPLGVTPLHVASLMAAIARGGEMVRPTIVRPGDGGPESARFRLPVSRVHVDMIREGMRQVILAGTGAKAWREHGGRELGFDACGKSGTAQVGPQWRYETGPDGVRRRVILREGNMTWFAGYAPSRNPKVAFVALVEYVPYESSHEANEVTGGGATVAAPLCIEALKACKELGYIRGE